MDSKLIEKLTQLKTVQDRTSNDVTEIMYLLREQNGRVRENEKAISRLNIIASLMVTSITGFVAWLFGKQ